MHDRVILGELAGQFVPFQLFSFERCTHILPRSDTVCALSMGHNLTPNNRV
jgi:hypothetical protein